MVIPKELVRVHNEWSVTLLKEYFDCTFLKVVRGKFMCFIYVCIMLKQCLFDWIYSKLEIVSNHYSQSIDLCKVQSACCGPYHFVGYNIQSVGLYYDKLDVLQSKRMMALCSSSSGNKVFCALCILCLTYLPCQRHSLVIDR